MGIQNQALFADIDARSAVTVAMVIIGFVVWVIRQVAAAKEAPPPTVRPRRNRSNDRLQNEIDSFLEENEGQNRGRRDEPVIEVVPDEEIVRRQRNRQQQRSRSQRPTTRSPANTGGKRGGSGAGGKTGRPQPAPAQSPELGSGVRSHLQDYMDSRRVEQSVQRHLGGHVVATAARNVGTLAHKEDVTALQSQHPLVAILRDPVGVQNAVLLSEILTPRYKNRKR